MIYNTDLADYVASIIKEVNDGIDAAGKDGCNNYRLRSISFGGEVVFEDRAVAAQVATNEPIEDTTIITEEAPSTESQESSDTLTQRTQRGGDKIFERESNTEE